MRRQLFLFSFMFLWQYAAATDLSGSLTGDLDAGTHQVVDTISVDLNDTLRILPGAVLSFNGPFPFKIYGVLLAEGTESDSIVFTTDTLVTPGRWCGLRFHDPGSSASLLSYCLIENSKAESDYWLYERGGGVLCDSSSPGFTHCTFRGNDAETFGGGIFCWRSADASFTSCLIENNAAGFGGGVYCNNCQPSFVNCIVAGNEARQYGGGIYLTRSSAVVSHCTLYDNAADSPGAGCGGGFELYQATPTITGTIVANSQGAGIEFWGSPDAQIEYCDFYGSTLDEAAYWSSDPAQGPDSVSILVLTNANGDSCDNYFNIFRDPRLTNADSGDFHLSDLSRCLGAGSEDDPPPQDYEGNSRPNPPGSAPDIGAFEHELAEPYTPEGLSGQLSGVIGPGFFYVIDTVSIQVEDTLTLVPGTILSFYGPYPFIIEGTLLAEGTVEDSIVFTTDLGLNPYRWRGLRFLELGSSGSRLVFCRIENGCATGPDSQSKHGGGAYCHESRPSFTNCDFLNNLAHWGGGVSCRYYSPTFTNCLFRGNRAETYGGGVYGWYSSQTFTNCIFIEDTAHFGGAVCCSGSSPVLSHCTLFGNVSTVNGAGVYCSNSSPQIKSTVISNSEGAGIYFYNGSGSTVQYCDFFANSGADFAFSSGDSTNGPSAIGVLTEVNANEDSCDGFFNIFLDPAFVDTVDGDLHLADTSSCIGAAQVGDSGVDYEGNPRPNPAETRPDIGAFENENGPELPEGLSGNLSGTLDPGHYAVVDTIFVEAEDSLNLQAGTTFEFHGAYPFIVYGTLLAEGTESDSIRFTADSLVNPALWRGIRFLDATSSGSRLDYCLIENGVTADTGFSAYGGGAFCYYSSPEFNHCSFRNNSGGWGGGLSCWYGSPDVIACDFHGNTAATYGGNLYAWQSNLNLINCVVDDGSATFGGGACFSGGSPLIMHCSFIGNTASGSGGGIFCTNTASVIGNTVVAFSSGSGIYFVNSPAAQVTYCDIYGNSEGDIDFSGDDPEHGPLDIGINTEVNANGDSCDASFNVFLNPMMTDVENGDYHLTDYSPCIGAAETSLIDDDFTGGLRPNPGESLPDVGAFESERGTPLPADGLVGYLRGTLGPDSFRVLDDIYILVGDTLILMPGTVLDFSGPYAFQIEGVLLAEGTESDSIVFTTDTLQNPERWRGLRFIGSGSSGSRLTRCIVEFGLADGDEIIQRHGGCVTCDHSSPTFRCCIFRSSQATWGGGMSCWYASPEVDSCAFYENRAFSFGGGLYAWYSGAVFSHCLFYRDTADYGGGAYCSGDSVDFFNCTFYGNGAAETGGGLSYSFSSGNINSTIIAGSEGSGLYFWSSDTCRVEYCDLFDNTGGNIVFSQDDPSQGPVGIGMLDTTNSNDDSSDVYMNIFLDPMFADTIACDLTLVEGSPCIDAGDPDLPADPDGTTADIGALFYDWGFRPPSPFQLLSPASGDTCRTLDTLLVWEEAADQDVGDLVSYEIWLDTLEDLSTAEMIVSGVEDTTHSLTELTDDQSYYWTVHASDLNSDGTWAEDTLDFVTYYPESPLSFQLAQPEDGAVIETGTPTLQWYKAVDPDPDDSVCYRLYWSYHEDFEDSVEVTLCDTFYTFPEEILLNGSSARKSRLRLTNTRTTERERLDDLPDDTVVYWKVKAVDRFGLETWCEPVGGWHFSIFIEQPPEAFDLLSPADGDTLDSLTVLFDWEASVDPDPGDSVTFYRLYLARDSLFSAELDSQDVVGTGCPWSGLTDDADYWWKVKAFDVNDNGSFSNDVWTFSTYRPDPPLAFDLAAPLNHETVFTQTPTVQWYAADDPDPGDTVYYRLVWSYDSTFSVFEEVSLCDTSFVFTESMLMRTADERLRQTAGIDRRDFRNPLDEVDDDSTVFWKVEAVDGFGLTTWCEPETGWRFYVYIEQPPSGFDLISPAAGDTLDSLQVLLSWETASDPDPADSIEFYRVYLAEDSLFTINADSQDVSFTEWLEENLDDDRIYWWKVRAFDTHGSSTASNEVRRFYTCYPENPETFTLVSPLNDDTVFTTTPTLIWNSANDPDPGDTVCYRLMWSYDGDFAVFEDTTLCDTVFIFPPEVLLTGETEFHMSRDHGHSEPGLLTGLDEVEEDSIVYWRVQAVDGFGLTAWCEPEDGWHFTVYIEEPPLGFNLLSPANDETINSLLVHFIWDAAVDPDPGDSIAFYRVFIALDSLFTVEIDSMEALETELLWDSLDDDETYWWKVRAFDLHGNWVESNQIQYFHTYYCEPPAPFDLLAPSDSSYLSSNVVEFCWEEAVDPDPGDLVSYMLQISAPDTSAAFDAGTDTCLAVNIEPLRIPGDVNVEWWVEAASICPDTTIESRTHYHFYPPSAVPDDGITAPRNFTLHQNYPNPFNATTVIRFDVARAGHVSVKVYDLLGQEVAVLLDESKSPGEHSIVWKASAAPSGVYLCRMEAGDFRFVRKMLLIK